MWGGEWPLSSAHGWSTGEEHTGACAMGATGRCDEWPGCDHLLVVVQGLRDVCQQELKVRVAQAFGQLPPRDLDLCEHLPMQRQGCPDSPVWKDGLLRPG